jgi:hypothetical protein
MPRPIFIVGKQRSGTTWLGNLLLSHPRVAGVHHEAHHGIHESAYFSHVAGRYGDLSRIQNYTEFASVMARSDYFRLAGASFDDLMDLYPASYAQVFRAVMDRFARRQGASCWVEKTPMHTEHMHTIAAQYPDARFVGIQRDPVGVAFSSVRRQGRLSAARRLLALARVTTDKYLLDGLMHRTRARFPERVHILQYDDLLTQRSATLDRLCDALGLPAEEMHSPYAANSSYGRASLLDEKPPKTDERRPPYEAMFVRQLYVNVLPNISLDALAGLKRLLYAEASSSLPPWFFKLLSGPSGAESTTDLSIS